MNFLFGHPIKIIDNLLDEEDHRNIDRRIYAVITRKIIRTQRLIALAKSFYFTTEDQYQLSYR